MKRFVCIHGHFYQPPRENPWLETVEIQDSARPYHDWNERITAECYAPNGAARILGADGLIGRIVNNYEYISFNIGPTLMSWMEKFHPTAYRLMQEADANSVRQRSGHGNAMAQVYNHVIMPLASPRDKETQVLWGKKDFFYRFGREPEGMWLAETAADMPSLRALARQGIKFTVLAPNQCARIRPLATADKPAPTWTDIGPDAVDPKRAYRINLGDGLKIDVFFYDGPISRGIAFENLLGDGLRYASRVLDAFVGDRDEAQLVHLATDGESYGHHAHHGEMALAFALNVLTSNEVPIKVTNYGEFLELFPPQYEAQIYEPSSWSCAHGVGRWSDNCGCTSRGDWHQLWRAPLRLALDWLRSQIDPLFESLAGKLLKDPWDARNDYIEVVLQRSPEHIDSFFARHRRTELSAADQVTLLKLLEMQRHGMLMYTSCGWFFDDISRLEGVQILRYAARAVQLARDVGLDCEAEFVRHLEQAPSNVPDFGHGAGVWEREVASAFVDLRRVVAHYAIHSLVDGQAPAEDVFCYQVTPLDYHREAFGQTGWAIGRVTVTSTITRETLNATFAVLHFGAQDFHCCVGDPLDPETFDDLKGQLSKAYNRYSMTQLLRLLDRHFGEEFYTIKDMLADERRRILFTTMKDVLARYESSYRNLFDQSMRMIQYLIEIGTPPPVEFLSAASYVVRSDLEKALANPGQEIPPAAMTAIRRARKWGIPLELDRIELQLRRSIEKTTRELIPEITLDTLTRLENQLNFADAVPIPLVLWETQNYVHDAIKKHAAALARDPQEKDKLDLLLWLARRCQLNARPYLEAVPAAPQEMATA